MRSTWPLALALATLEMPHGQLSLMNHPGYLLPEDPVTTVPKVSPQNALMPGWLQWCYSLLAGQGIAIAHPSWRGDWQEGHWHVDLDASIKGNLGALGPALGMAGRMTWPAWQLGGHLLGVLGTGGCVLRGDGSLVHPPFTLRLSLWQTPSEWGYSGFLILRKSF